MKKLKITYVSKSRIYPSFGDANETPPRIRIRIRKDLPIAVKKFVLEHEKYHIKDYQKLTKENKKYYWIWGEIKANFFGAIKHPFRALICFLMSLSPARLKFYWQRIKKSK